MHYTCSQYDILLSTNFKSGMDLAADFESTSPSEVTQDQAEVVLVGCGAPNRGMGW
jgi:hypothetical protein